MGSGTIEERNGRFRVRLRLSGQRRDLGTYATRAEAEAVLQSAIDGLGGDAGAAAAGAITLRAWVERWLVHRELSGAVRSADDDRSRLRAHVLDQPWADDPIDTITTRQLRAWVQSLMLRRARFHDGRGGLLERQNTLSRHTVAHVYATLRVCLRDAVEAGHLEENPARGIRLPKALYTREPWTYLTQAEIEQVTGCAAIPELYRLLFTVAIYTGLRKGELWGLRWSDCYLDHATPHLMVRRSRTSAPKNGKIRLVPLLAPARVALERLCALRHAGGLAVARKVSSTALQGDRAALDAELLVFPATDGSMRSRWDVARWKPRRVPYLLADGTRKHRVDPGYRQLSGIVRAVRFHDLRHTCASHLLMGTWGRAWRLEEVRDLLGHSDVTVTQRYAHLSPDRLHAAAAATVIATSPTLAPSTPPSSKRAPLEVPVLTSESGRSHLRDLNPRPTVYESTGEPSDGASLDGVGAGLGPAEELQSLALEVLRQVGAGALTREAADELAAAVLALPLPRAARELAKASHDRRAARAVCLAELVIEALAATLPETREADA